MKDLKLQEMCEAGLCCLIIVVLVILMFKKENFALAYAPNYCRRECKNDVCNWLFQPDGNDAKLARGEVELCDKLSGYPSGCMPSEQKTYGEPRICSEESMSERAGLGQGDETLRDFQLYTDPTKTEEEMRNEFNALEIARENPKGQVIMKDEQLKLAQEEWKKTCCYRYGDQENWSKIKTETCENLDNSGEPPQYQQYRSQCRTTDGTGLMDDDMPSRQ